MPFLIFLIPMGMLLHALASSAYPVPLILWIVAGALTLLVLLVALLHEVSRRHR